MAAFFHRERCANVQGKSNPNELNTQSEEKAKSLSRFNEREADEMITQIDGLLYNNFHEISSCTSISI